MTQPQTWADFWSEYQLGAWNGRDVPPRPPFADEGEPLSDVEQQIQRDGFLRAPIPIDEVERLNAFFRYGNLKTGMNGSAELNRLRILTQTIFQVETCAITLFASETMYTTSECNLPLPTLDRNLTFCQHTLTKRGSEPMVILDATKDWRLSGNPFVVNPPFIHFYISCPIVTDDGYKIGTLCLIDARPRDVFSDGDQKMLMDLAAMVMRELNQIRLVAQNEFAAKLNRQVQSYTKTLLTSNIDSKFSEMSDTYSQVTESARSTLDVDGIAILDIDGLFTLNEGSTPGEETISLVEQKTKPYQSQPHNSQSVPASMQPYSRARSALPQHTLPILAHSTSPSIKNTTNASDNLTTTDYLIVSHYDVFQTLSKSPNGAKFDSTTLPSWLSSLIPPSPTNSTSSSMLIPIWQYNTSSYILIFAYSVSSHLRAANFTEGFELEYLQATGDIMRTVNAELQMKSADKAKSQFISSISHELTTPLHGLGALAEILEDAELSPVDRSHLNALQGCTNTLMGTVDSVLDYAKISHRPTAKRGSSGESGKSHLVKINLAALVEEVVETTWIGTRTFRNGAGSTGSFYTSISNYDDSASGSDSPVATPVSFTFGNQKKKRWVDCVIDLEVTTDEFWVYGDRGGLSRVLMNLLTNALKYTRKGFVEVSLRSVGQSKEDGAKSTFELVVRDTGRGMSKDFLKSKLFMPFTQQDSQEAGIGLGLSTVKAIVQSYPFNGQVQVSSEEKVGTSVKVFFEAEMSTPETPTPTLQALISKRNFVSLFGFGSDVGQQRQKEVLTVMLVAFGFELVDPLGKQDCVVIVNETSCLETAPLEVLKRPILLCSSMRNDPEIVRLTANVELAGGTCGLLFKPFGPIRLRSLLETTFAALHQPAPSLPSVSSELILAATTMQLESTNITPIASESTDFSGKFSESSMGSVISIESANTVDSDMTSKWRILVVEDNPLNTKVLCALLKKKKLKHDQAVNGLVGFEMVRSQAPGYYDMIFMDLTMPVMDGFESTQKIRELEEERGGEKCLIYALTGLSSEKDQAKAYEAGVDNYLVKPLPLKVLSTLLENYAQS